MSDDLRDRIAAVIERTSVHTITTCRDIADEIIDDLGLRVESADGREETFQRAVGKWER